MEKISKRATGRNVIAFIAALIVAPWAFVGILWLTFFLSKAHVQSLADRGLLIPAVIAIMAVALTLAFVLALKIFWLIRSA